MFQCPQRHSDSSIRRKRSRREWFLRSPSKSKRLPSVSHKHSCSQHWKTMSERLSSTQWKSANLSKQHQQQLKSYIRSPTRSKRRNQIIASLNRANTSTSLPSLKGESIDRSINSPPVCSIHKSDQAWGDFEINYQSILRLGGKIQVIISRRKLCVIDSSTITHSVSLVGQMNTKCAVGLPDWYRQLIDWLWEFQ